MKSSLILRRNESGIARAVSLFWYKRIVIGNGFDCLPDDMKIASLFHEEGHLRNHHTEQRILVFFLLPFLFRRLCKHQEFIADKYAVDNGYAKPLLRLLSSDFDGGALQPSHNERREAIKFHEQNRLSAVNA